ncbi:MAG: hypothetical protein ACN4GR_01220 [Arenicellales bacterium]
MQQVLFSLVKRCPGYLLSGTLAIFILSYPAILTADNYLDTLEAEAEATTVLQKAQMEHKKLLQLSSRQNAKPAEARKNSEKMKPTTNSSPQDTAKLFEAGLYREFPGNYIVFINLSDDDKKTVITAFEESKNIDGLMQYGKSLALIMELATK